MFQNGLFITLIFHGVSSRSGASGHGYKACAERATKSDFEARPVYLSRQERIKAHFLICFVALVIARLLQRRLGGKFSIASITGCLSKASFVRALRKTGTFWIIPTGLLLP